MNISCPDNRLDREQTVVFQLPFKIGENPVRLFVQFLLELRFFHHLLQGGHFRFTKHVAHQGSAKQSLHMHQNYFLRWA